MTYARSKGNPAISIESTAGCSRIETYLLAFGFREKAVFLGLFVLAFIANKTAKDLLECLVDIH